MKYNYSKALIELRSKLDISQTELTYLLSVVYASVNRWKNGKFEPTMKCKKKLHELFVEANMVKEN